MPTYVYACTNPDCGHRFETVQAFTDAALTECPVCGQRLRKVFGSVGVVFKGSGFYRNDSREKAGAGVGKGDGGAESSRSGEKASGDSASGGSAGSGGPGGDKVAAKSSDSATGAASNGKSGDGKSGDGKSSTSGSANGRSADGRAAHGRSSDAGPSRPAAGTAAGSKSRS